MEESQHCYPFNKHNDKDISYNSANKTVQIVSVILTLNNLLEISLTLVPQLHENTSILLCLKRLPNTQVTPIHILLVGEFSTTHDALLSTGMKTNR